MTGPALAPHKRALLADGIVIPAHPLALDDGGRLDKAGMEALTRYYVESGAGGLAVGVHTTQFGIRSNGLLEPVLSLVARTADACASASLLKVAGACGATEQALVEAELARELGYDAVLLSMTGLADWSDGALLERTRAVAAVLPVCGFYIQPAVGGRRFGVDFWRRLADIDNVVMIKVAPFNRYWTLDVVRGVCESSRAAEVALYTGNDDAIVADLLTTFHIAVRGGIVEKSIVGGLLGQWAVGTGRAVELLAEIKDARATGVVPSRLLTVGAQLTEVNAAIFDSANDFAGCIAGVNEVLRRLGLIASARCLDDRDRLSPGQDAEIARVVDAYPDLLDAARIGELTARAPTR